MRQAKRGDRVKVHYKGCLEDGTIFDTSVAKKPLEFSIGQNVALPALERAVIGMKEGETKKVTISPEEAYGPHRADLVVTVERSMLASDANPRLGMRLKVGSPDGQFAEVTVTDVSENRVTLDANHPFAGEQLTFDIKLVEIVDDGPIIPYGMGTGGAFLK